MRVVIEGQQGEGKTSILDALRVCGFEVSDERAVGGDNGSVEATVTLPAERSAFFIKVFGKRGAL